MGDSGPSAVVLAQEQTKADDPNQFSVLNWMSGWGTRTGSHLPSLKNLQVYIKNIS